MDYVTIQPGDHILYGCGSHSHHGIYCGDISYRNKHYREVVIHYEGKQKRGQIRGLSLEKFAQDREIFICLYKGCFDPETVVRRAVNRLGEEDYNLLFNNCEHFAHWCKTGKSISDQINSPAGTIGGLIGGLISGAAVGAVTAFLPLSIPGAVLIGACTTAGYAGGHLGISATESFLGGSARYKR